MREMSRLNVSGRTSPNPDKGTVIDTVTQIWVCRGIGRF